MNQNGSFASEIHAEIFADEMVGCLGFTSKPSGVQVDGGVDDKRLFTDDNCQSWVMGVLEFDALFFLLFVFEIYPNA